jgi:hypothetical protein
LETEIAAKNANEGEKKKQVYEDLKCHIDNNRNSDKKIEKPQMTKSDHSCTGFVPQS